MSVWILIMGWSRPGFIMLKRMIRTVWPIPCGQCRQDYIIDNPGSGYQRVVLCTVVVRMLMTGIADWYREAWLINCSKCILTYDRPYAKRVMRCSLLEKIQKSLHMHASFRHWFESKNSRKSLGAVHTSFKFLSDSLKAATNILIHFFKGTPNFKSI